MLKEKHFEIKTKSYHSRRKTSEVERTFKNLGVNTPEIIDKPIEEIINGQLDIKLELFIEEKLDALFKTIESRKAAGLEIWKTRKFDDINFLTQ